MRYGEPIPVNLKVGRLAVSSSFVLASKAEELGMSARKGGRGHSTHYAGKSSSLNAVAAIAHSRREGFMAAVAESFGGGIYVKRKKLRYDTTLISLEQLYTETGDRVDNTMPDLLVAHRDYALHINWTGLSANKRRGYIPRGAKKRGVILELNYV